VINTGQSCTCLRHGRTSEGLAAWTSTTSTGSECSLPDFHHKLQIKVFPAGPQPQKNYEDIPNRIPERMSEDMPNRMPERMSEHMPERMTSRWYARNYVRIMDQGGDHSKKVISAPTIRIIQ